MSLASTRPGGMRSRRQSVFTCFQEISLPSKSRGLHGNHIGTRQSPPQKSSLVPLHRGLCLAQWPSWPASAHHLPGSNGDQSTLVACSDNREEPLLGGRLCRNQQHGRTEWNVPCLHRINARRTLPSPVIHPKCKIVSPDVTTVSNSLPSGQLNKWLSTGSLHVSTPSSPRLSRIMICLSLGPRPTRMKTLLSRREMQLPTD